jgi:hypothetical protein
MVLAGLLGHAESLKNLSRGHSTDFVYLNGGQYITRKVIFSGLTIAYFEVAQTRPQLH